MVLKRGLFLGVGFFLLPLASQAMTPQKYCESLAATSCEVLNMEPMPIAMVVKGNPSGSEVTAYQSSHLLVKYCRNQKFRMAFYDYETYAVSSSLLPKYNTGGTTITLKRSKDTTLESASVEASSAGLCGVLP